MLINHWRKVDERRSSLAGELINSPSLSLHDLFIRPLNDSAAIKILMFALAKSETRSRRSRLGAWPAISPLGSWTDDES